MEWANGLTLSIMVLVATFAIIATIWLLNKQQQANTSGNIKSLSEGFESLSRNMLLIQKEFERGQEAKLSVLRTELSQELAHGRKELQEGLKQTSLGLENRVAGLDQKLEGRLNQMSQNVQTKLEENIKNGFTHFEKVQNSLKEAELQLANLNNVGRSINDLNNLLKLPHLRGNFGEAMLESLLSDILPQDAYELQYKIVPTSAERVDAVVKYPNCVLPIDSKFPREKVLPLFETQDPAQLEAAQKTLTEVMRGMAKSIKEKYIHPEHGTTEMALLFVPSETLYFEMLRNVKLYEELGKMKVFAVSPNTLSVTLHAIGLARGYYEMARGVEKTLSDLRKSQQHFKNFEGRFEEIGNALNRAQSAFSTATTHLSRYESAVNRMVGAEEIPTEVLSEGNA